MTSHDQVCEQVTQWLEQGRLADVEKLASEALTQNPTWVGLRYALALMHSWSGQWEDMDRQLELLFAVCSDHAPGRDLDQRWSDQPRHRATASGASDSQISQTHAPLVQQVLSEHLAGNWVEVGMTSLNWTESLARTLNTDSHQDRTLVVFDDFTSPRRSLTESQLRDIVAQTGGCQRFKIVNGPVADTIVDHCGHAGMIGYLQIGALDHVSVDEVWNRLERQMMLGGRIWVSAEVHPLWAPRSSHQGRTQWTKHAAGWAGIIDRDFEIAADLDEQLVRDFQTDDLASQELECQMSTNERFGLYWTVRKLLPLTSPVIRFVEVGSYAGASLQLLYKAFQRLGRPFEGISVEPVGRPQYYQVLPKLKDHVAQLKMFSNAAAPHLRSIFSDDGIWPELIFIDGDHTYEGVARDIEDYLPMCAPGGIIAFHDFLPALDANNRDIIFEHHGGHEPGIRKACLEAIESRGLATVEPAPLLYPNNPCQTQPWLPIIPNVRSTLRLYRKPPLGH